MEMVLTMVFENFKVVFYTGIFLLPGYIIKSILDYLVPPQRHNDAKYYLFCFFFSILNCAVWSWAYVLVLVKVPAQSGWHWVYLLLITLMGSSALAVIIGFIRQKGWIRDLLSRLHPIHPCPTAWDFHFSKQKSSWVIVTLISGEKIYGKYGENSFAASDIDEHDLYLEKIYALDDHENWLSVNGDNGILISGKSISCIEFLTGD